MISDYRKVTFTGGFWKSKEDLNRKVTNGAVYDRFKESGRIGAFKFKDKNCHIYWDSDVAKWMEAAAYILAGTKDPELETKVEELIDDIIENQCEDGYFNIYYTVVAPDKRWSDRDCCELYCAGHLFEAAIAYYEATGRDRFLKAMEKYADLIAKVFTVDHSSSFKTPGSEEIELALYRMYKTTGKNRFYELMKYFLETRGQPDNNEQIIWHPKHIQAHAPIREQHEALGHAVRATYLYAAMADYAKESGDRELLNTCRDLFSDITERKMYITGGIGSTSFGEAFTVPYDLPNSGAYTETCASIGLMLFANRMLKADPDHPSKYADTVELEMYNGMLSGLSLDGEQFFYENPLEIDLTQRRRHAYIQNDRERWPASQRSKLFNCSCCPPNITRTLASIGEYFYTYDEDNRVMYINQFGESEYRDGDIIVSQRTDYPVSGSIRIESTVPVCVRIPGWCHNFSTDQTFELRNGYALFDGGTVEITFDIVPELVTANPAVNEDAGKAALRRGPVIYCAEGTDNGRVHDLFFDSASVMTAQTVDDVSGLPALRVTGARLIPSRELYAPLKKEYEKTTIKMIPYHSFANRGESDMLVFMPYI